MRAYIFIALLVAIQSTSATAPIEKIKERLATGIATGLKVLTEKAASKLHKLGEEIDLKKLQHLNVLKILPVHHKPYVEEHYSKKTPYVIDPHQVERLKHYFEQKKEHLHFKEHLHKLHHHEEHLDKPHHEHHHHNEHIHHLPALHQHYGHFHHYGHPLV